MKRFIAFCAAVSCGRVGSVFAQSTAPAKATAADASKLFEPIRRVLQNPRYQNCHIPGDAPMQYDGGMVHAQNVRRGADGKGFAALQCSACHQSENSAAVLGPHAPPGAPDWHLPPENMNMIFIGLNARDLCLTVKDPKRNGKRNIENLVHHMAEDKLVDWGWHPGGDRKPVPISKEDTVSAVKAWVVAGAPCPTS